MFFANGYEKGQKEPRIKHWQAAERQGVTPQALKDKPELPENGVYIWSTYIDIKKGCESITWTDIEAYQKNMGNLTAWEIDLMFEIDQLRKQWQI